MPYRGVCHTCICHVTYEIWAYMTYDTYLCDVVRVQVHTHAYTHTYTYIQIHIHTHTYLCDEHDSDVVRVQGAEQPVRDALCQDVCERCMCVCVCMLVCVYVCVCAGAGVCVYVIE
jgi:hypothetical protein